MFEKYMLMKGWKSGTFTYITALIRGKRIIISPSSDQVFNYSYFPVFLNTINNKKHPPEDECSDPYHFCLTVKFTISLVLAFNYSITNV